MFSDFEWLSWSSTVTGIWQMLQAIIETYRPRSCAVTWGHLDDCATWRHGLVILDPQAGDSRRNTSYVEEAGRRRLTSSQSPPHRRSSRDYRRSCQACVVHNVACRVCVCVMHAHSHRHITTRPYLIAASSRRNQNSWFNNIDTRLSPTAKYFLFRPKSAHNLLVYVKVKREYRIALNSLN